MSLPRLVLLAGLLLLGGCLWPVRENTDVVVDALASHPYDLAPPDSPAAAAPAAEKAAPAREGKPAALVAPPTDVQTAALMQPQPGKPAPGMEKELTLPADLPGSETPIIPRLDKMTPEQKLRYYERLYPVLPPLPVTPAALPGPDGRPYTLADLQKLAAENSPALRQAASDVQAAEGALVQARTYTNPTIGYSASPTNNNTNAGAQGIFLQQHLTMWGKRALAVAAAQKDLDNAQLALRRARSDLATNVRNAYFALIVAKETVRVDRSLARFTDQVYRLFVGYLRSGFIAAPHDPAPLRAQAYTTRLAYQQAITGYVYAWNQLVATIGLHHLPLTEVSGRVDRFIPYYDYDKVLAHVLTHHTDVLTARNGLEKARYNLKLAQITPYPDMDVYGAVWKESTIPPFVIFYSAQVGFPIPIWDQNKGNIMSAQGALARAAEESHRVEMFWTNTLAAAYANYQNNLNALEAYRRHVLPDQVRYYRGVFLRRTADPTASPGDLVAAQQMLASNVQAYLGILGSLWSAVVSVADPLQTDDLFQMAQPRELPELPDLDNMPHWPCPHGRVSDVHALPPGGPPACGPGSGCPAGVGPPPALPGTPATPAREPTLPAPRRLELPPVQGPAGGKLPDLSAVPRDRTSPGSVPLPPAGPAAGVIPASLEEPLLAPPPEVLKVPEPAGGQH